MYMNFGCDLDFIEEYKKANGDKNGIVKLKSPCGIDYPYEYKSRYDNDSPNYWGVDMSPLVDRIVYDNRENLNIGITRVGNVKLSLDKTYDLFDGDLVMVNPIIYEEVRFIKEHIKKEFDSDWFEHITAYRCKGSRDFSFWKWGDYAFRTALIGSGGESELIMKDFRNLISFMNICIASSVCRLVMPYHFTYRNDQVYKLSNIIRYTVSPLDYGFATGILVRY